MSENNGAEAVLELYRTTVRNMLSSNRQGIVPNASYKHAAIIIEELVRSAKSRFFAYCEKLSCDVWTRQVIEQLQLAIQRNVDVQIVVTDDSDIDVPEFLRSRVRTLHLDQLGETRSSYEALNHFAVVDGRSARLEQNRQTREALFAANQPALAEELEGIFSHLQEASRAA